MIKLDVYDLSPELLYSYIVDDLGGVVFTDPYLMNIVALRNADKVDEWNDALIYFYFDEDNHCHLTRITEFTTDPGLKYLKSPINKLGTAIVVEGWYRKLWKLGKHKNQYEALVQYNPISVYRDNDKDNELDRSAKTIETGMFGINLHRAEKYSDADSVDKYSAGCFVVRKYSDWEKFINTVHLCYNQGNQRYWSLALLDFKSL